MEDNDHKAKLPVHLILGASDYMCIKTGEPSRFGKNWRACGGENQMWVDHNGTREGRLDVLGLAGFA